MVFSGSNLQKHTNCISRLFLTNLSNYCNKHLSLFSENVVVLIVDNDADNLLLSTQIVRMCGYSAIAAGDGETALKMIEQYQPALVLLEIMLPEIDGINVVSYLREHHNSVPVIALTSLPCELYREQALMAGCNKYIEKPFQIEELETAMKQLIYLPSTVSNYNSIL